MMNNAGQEGPLAAFFERVDGIVEIQSGTATLVIQTEWGILLAPEQDELLSCRSVLFALEYSPAGWKWWFEVEPGIAPCNHRFGQGAEIVALVDEHGTRLSGVGVFDASETQGGESYIHFSGVGLPVFRMADGMLRQQLAELGLPAE